MFNYYGSKLKLSDLYKIPSCDLIIEPFAGSARYALKYFQKDVILVDKDERIVKVWKYLQNASPHDIFSLPRLKFGQNLDLFNLSEDEYLFLSFMVAVGSTGRKSMTDYGNKSYDRNIRSIANQLHKIKHWKIIHGYYNEIENQKATWFIDPPYQLAGQHYKESSKNIDFGELSEWCLGRLGQVIVCENDGATWLPFTKLTNLQGLKNKKSVEVVYYQGFSDFKSSIF
jgi:site-specific DNA-adenine methylase